MTRIASILSPALLSISFVLIACDGGGASADDGKSPAEVEAEKVWTSRCVNCHGSSGKGDGPGAATLDPKPRSFADPGWQGQTSDERITKAILEGGMGVQMSPAMPANPDLEKKPEVVKALVLKIRKLQQ